jgi:hypothetical protein
VPLLLPSPASLWEISLPSPPSALRAPCPLCYVSFLLLLLIIQVFFLFSLGGGWSVQGAMLIWPRVVCRSTVCHLAHLVVRIFPSHLGMGTWQWVAQGPSWFLHLTWSGDAMSRLEVWWGQSFASSQWFFL